MVTRHNDKIPEMGGCIVRVRDRLRRAGEWRGRSFRLGEADCVQFLKYVFPEMPDEWGHLSLDNYKEFHSHPSSMEYLRDFIREWTIPVSSVRPCDIAFFRKAGYYFFGVSIGNTNFLVPTVDFGVRAVSCSKPVEVRRVV